MIQRQLKRLVVKQGRSRRAPKPKPKPRRASRPQRRGRGLPNRNALPRLLTGIENPRCLEIGVRRGAYTDVYTKQLPADSEFYLLDSWLPGGRPGGRQREAKLYPKRSQDQCFAMVQRKYANRPNIHIVRGLSPESAMLFEDDYFDWIYIDACHQYHAVLADMRAFWPKLKIGGIFSGHDYMKSKLFQVIQAVAAFFGSLKVQTTGEPRNKSWWIRKTPEVAQTIYGYMK